MTVFVDVTGPYSEIMLSSGVCVCNAQIQILPNFFGLLVIVIIIIVIIIINWSLGGQHGGCVLVVRKHFSSNTVVIPMSGAASVHDRVLEFV